MTFKSFLDEIVYRVASCIVIVTAATLAFSLVEGKLYPVVGELTVTNPRARHHEYTTEFDGSAEKYRDCVWKRTEWYIGSRQGSAVKTTGGYSGPPALNLVGRLTWEGQYARMSRSELLTKSYANVVHRCPWRLWDTVTPFYTSTGEPT